MSDNFDVALKAGAYTADIETGPVMGTPAHPYQARYPVQAGYPTQGWPAGAPPGYGSTPTPYGAQPYPCPPPPLVGGGTDDEKFQINDVGVCTTIPGLKGVNFHLQIFIIGMCVVFGGCMGGLAVWLVTIGAGVASIGLWVAGGINLLLAILFGFVMRKNRPTAYPRMTEEAIDAFMERVTNISATLPQINAVRALMAQANPNTPHEFQVWKSAVVHTDNTNQSGRLVAANFGLQNLSAGQKAQLHLYTLV